MIQMRAFKALISSSTVGIILLFELTYLAQIAIRLKILMTLMIMNKSSKVVVPEVVIEGTPQEQALTRYLRITLTVFVKVF